MSFSQVLYCDGPGCKHGIKMTGDPHNPDQTPGYWIAVRRGFPSLTVFFCSWECASTYGLEQGEERREQEVH